MSRLPTLLTILRILAAPIIAALILYAATQLYIDPHAAGLLFAGACTLFILVAATDWLDGWLARKLDAVSTLGAALDHVADKVLVACTLAALAYASFNLDLTLAAIIIIARDVGIAGLREGLAQMGRALPVQAIGKWKAAAEMAGVSVYLAFQATALIGGAPRVIFALDWTSHILIWVAAALALLSGALYALRAARPAASV